MAAELQNLVGQFKYGDSDIRLSEMKASVRSTPRVSAPKPDRQRKPSRHYVSSGAGAKFNIDSNVER